MWKPPAPRQVRRTTLARRNQPKRTTRIDRWAHSRSGAADPALGDGDRRTTASADMDPAGASAFLSDDARSARLHRVPGTCTKCPEGTRRFGAPRATARAHDDRRVERPEAARPPERTPSAAPVRPQRSGFGLEEARSSWHVDRGRVGARARHRGSASPAFESPDGQRAPTRSWRSSSSSTASCTASTL